MLQAKLITLLDEPSNEREKFRVIMDLAFGRLGKSKECGYILSLFPGKFDMSAAIAAIKPSNPSDDYHLTYQDRHKLIKEYLKEKLHNVELYEYVFNVRFTAHYVSLLLTLATRQELDTIDIHYMSSEVHNIDYLVRLLLNHTDLSAEELAVLGFLNCQ